MYNCCSEYYFEVTNNFKLKIVAFSRSIIIHKYFEKKI